MRQWPFYHVCAQSCLTLCDPQTAACLGPFACQSSSSVHGTFQAGILEWVAISFSRVSSQPRYWPCISYVSWIAGRFFPHEAIREDFVFFYYLSFNPFLGLPWCLDGKESSCKAGDPGLIPGFRRFPREGHGNPLQCFCLENPVDRGAWIATTHGVTKNQTRLNT